MKRWLLAALAMGAVLLPSGAPTVWAATPTPAPTMQIGSTFPGSVDDGLCDPTPTAATNNPSCPSSQLQADQNDAIQAVERKVGTGASTPSAGTYLGGTGDGTSAYEAFPAAPTPAPTDTPAPTATPIPPVATDTPAPTATPRATSTQEAQGYDFSTATPAVGCLLDAVSIAQVDCVAPGTAITPVPVRATDTPAPTATPIPAVATDTPIPAVATSTPQIKGVVTTATPPANSLLYFPGAQGTPAIYVTPVAGAAAPTAFPTCGAGVLAEGTGGQGLQCGSAALTTATPPANTYPYCSAGGAGCVLAYATPIPASASNPTLLTFQGVTPGSSGTFYIGPSSTSGTTTEANVQIPLAEAVTFTKMQVFMTVGGTVTVTLRKGGVSQTITCSISATTTCADNAHTFTGAAGDLITVQGVFTDSNAKNWTVMLGS